MKATATPVLSWRRQIWVLLHPPGHLTRLPCRPAAISHKRSSQRKLRQAMLSFGLEKLQRISRALIYSCAPQRGQQGAPKGSWLMAMTSLLSRMLRCEGSQVPDVIPHDQGALQT